MNTIVRFHPASILLATLTLFILTGGFSTPVHAALPQTVEQALKKISIPADAVSVWVQPVDAERPILQHHAEQPRNPASVMKLVTAFVTLDALGPAHTWTTHVSTNGSIREGVLEGDLFITGSADPVFSLERLWKLFRQLRAMGIHAIRGDIVLDGSVLKLPPLDPYAFDGRGLRPYNSGPYGLLVHFNTLQLLLVPGTSANAPVAVVPIPALPGMRIDNRITTSTGNCGIWYSRLDARMEEDDNGPRLVLLGNLPARCGAQSWGVSPLSPEQFSIAAVEALWYELGGTIQGSVHTGTTPAQRTMLTSNTSPALAEVVREMNKWSSNVIARQLLAILGSTDKSNSDMVATGAAAAAVQLQSAGIDTTGLYIENGSGLSRYARIRADSLGKMLVTAWRRPYMPEFIAALPIAGIDGTARRNLGRGGVRGQAHIKTGTINGVRAIAGYVQDQHGRRHAVVMMINHPRSIESIDAQNALLEWVWNGGG